MKKVFLFLFTFWHYIVFAQSPQSFNYQAVVRDNTGNPLANKAVNFRISILDNNINGTIQYQEIHNPVSNQFGMVVLEIGKGAVSQGNFSNITWANGSKFLRVELDINGGNAYTVIGSQQLLSVPYALYAEKSGNGSANSLTYSAGTGISIAGNTLTNTAPSKWSSATDGISYNNGNVSIGGTPWNPSGSWRKVLTLDNSTSNVGLTAPVFELINNQINVNSGIGSIAFRNGNAGHNSPQVLGMTVETNISNTNQADLHIGSTNSSLNYTNKMSIFGNGNIGIGTLSNGWAFEAKSKLHIKEGDIYLENASNGIIMKSPNGQCWRMTVNNLGQPIFTSITCP